MCEPSARPLYDFGDVHGPYTPASRRHSNVEGSVAEIDSSADPEFTVPEGPESIEVSRAVVSAGAGGVVPTRVSRSAMTSAADSARSYTRTSSMVPLKNSEPQTLFPPMRSAPAEVGIGAVRALLATCAPLTYRRQVRRS